MASILNTTTKALLTYKQSLATSYIIEVRRKISLSANTTPAVRVAVFFLLSYKHCIECDHMLDHMQ